MRLNEVTFNYKGYDEDGEEAVNIEHSFKTEGFLPDMLRHYKKIFYRCVF